MKVHDYREHAWRTLWKLLEIITPEADPGGTLRPPELTGRQTVWLAGLVILKRLRFIAVLAAVGLFIC